jgi:hypothetical protein
MSIVRIKNTGEKDGINVTSQDTCHLFKTMLSRNEAVVRAQKRNLQGCCMPVYFAARVFYYHFHESIPKTVRSIKSN